MSSEPIQSDALRRICDRWGLVPDGHPIQSRNARLLPVRRAGEALMLKLSHEPEEQRGAALMAWWAGQGAAHVLAIDAEALLLERAEGAGDLAALARSGAEGDDDATRILCASAAALHAPRPGPPPPALLPLAERFRALWPTADAQGGPFAEAAAAASGLLDRPEEPVVLHGDLHHGNVLDFGAHGWLAIDPKSLVGERAFDFANILCNPDTAVATTPGRFDRQLAIIAMAAELDPHRLATWVLAYAGLSAAWSLQDGEDTTPALLVASLAKAHLQR